MSIYTILIQESHDVNLGNCKIVHIIRLSESVRSVDAVRTWSPEVCKWSQLATVSRTTFELVKLSTAFNYLYSNPNLYDFLMLNQ